MNSRDWVPKCLTALSLILHPFSTLPQPKGLRLIGRAVLATAHGWGWELSGPKLVLYGFTLGIEN